MLHGHVNVMAHLESKSSVAFDSTIHEQVQSNRVWVLVASD